MVADATTARVADRVKDAAAAKEATALVEDAIIAARVESRVEVELKLYQKLRRLQLWLKMQ